MMQKQKGYSLINIFGLAIGIASCLLIFLYVQYELSFDRHHEKIDSLYRLASKGDMMGRYIKLITAPDPTAPALIKDIPEVKNATRFFQTNRVSIRYREKSFFETRLFFSSLSFILLPVSKSVYKRLDNI